MKSQLRLLKGLAFASLLIMPATSNATILQSSSVSWWYDPSFPILLHTPLGVAPAIAPDATRLLDIKSWHIDQTQTQAWYAGQDVLGLPRSPFNLNPPVIPPAISVDLLLTVGSTIIPIEGAEAFVYEITNVNYDSGNSFSFSTPTGSGNTGISGVRISAPGEPLPGNDIVPGSQFMSKYRLFPINLAHTLFGSVNEVDLTTYQQDSELRDWVMNASEDIEWLLGIDDFLATFTGVPPGDESALIGESFVFGFAMPGHWSAQVVGGSVNSWKAGHGSDAELVNATPRTIGFLAPNERILGPNEQVKATEPTTLAVFGFGLAALGWMRRRKAA